MPVDSRVLGKKARALAFVRCISGGGLFVDAKQAREAAKPDLDEVRRHDSGAAISAMRENAVAGGTGGGATRSGDSRFVGSMAELNDSIEFRIEHGGADSKQRAAKRKAHVVSTAGGQTAEIEARMVDEFGELMGGELPNEEVFVSGMLGTARQVRQATLEGRKETWQKGLSCFESYCATVCFARFTIFQLLPVSAAVMSEIVPIPPLLVIMFFWAIARGHVPKGGFEYVMADGSFRRSPFKEDNPKRKEQYTWGSVHQMVKYMSDWSHYYGQVVPTENSKYGAEVRAAIQMVKRALSTQRPNAAAGLRSATMALFYQTVDPFKWQEMQFATQCCLGEGFMWRPNEGWMLDLSAIEFVRLLASEDSAEKEVVRVKFICSKKDKFTSQPKRACGHRCGCEGSIASPVIVVGPDLCLNGLFRCYVCYSSWHVMNAGVDDGAFFRDPENQSWVIPFDQLTSDLRARLAAVNAALVACGQDELTVRNIKASMLRRTGATIRCVELGESEIMTMFQGRWNCPTTFRLYLEWKAQQLEASYAASRLGYASLSVAARNAVPSLNQIELVGADCVLPQDASEFDPEDTLPAHTGLPATVPLDDRRVVEHCALSAELKEKHSKLTRLMAELPVVFRVAQRVELASMAPAGEVDRAMSNCEDERHLREEICEVIGLISALDLLFQ